MIVQKALKGYTKWTLVGTQHLFLYCFDQLGQQREKQELIDVDKILCEEIAYTFHVERWR